MNLFAIKFNAGNDSNGNPRRVYVILSGKGKILKTYDEGYAGLDAVSDPEHRKCARWAREFATTPQEYRRLVYTYLSK